MEGVLRGTGRRLLAWLAGACCCAHPSRHILCTPHTHTPPSVWPRLCICGNSFCLSVSLSLCLSVSLSRLSLCEGESLTWVEASERADGERSPLAASRERERVNTDTHRQRDRETERQGDRETGRQRDRETGRQRHTHTLLLRKHNPHKQTSAERE
eukprot:901708-Rhodomonas_salina.1